MSMVSLQRRLVVFPRSAEVHWGHLAEAKRWSAPEPVPRGFGAVRAAIEKTLPNPWVRASRVLGAGRNLELWLPRGDEAALASVVRVAAMLGHTVLDTERGRVALMVAEWEAAVLADLLGELGGRLCSIEVELLSGRRRTSARVDEWGRVELRDDRGVLRFGIPFRKTAAERVFSSLAEPGPARGRLLCLLQLASAPEPFAALDARAHHA